MSYNNWDNWIEDAIHKKHIKYYAYENFSNIKIICSGCLGKSYRANWKNPRNILTLKSIDDSTIKEIVYNLKVRREMHSSDNILKFYGITIDYQNYTSKKYKLVMEYTDSGTLQSYLEKNINSLTWNDKFKMAHQLAYSVSVLHSENIIHCELHSRNVLVHRNNIKLADFGLSKKVIDDPDGSSQCPYIDPQRFVEDSYSPNKKGDVYSIGVLLWEISSCRLPFINESNQCRLPRLILQGLRETPISNTPKDYEKLYADCWKYSPDDRPTIYNVVVRLEEIYQYNNKTNKTEWDNWNEEAISRKVTYNIEWDNWIEEAISKKHIKRYDYKDFFNLKVIGSGGFGRVYRANWKNSKTFALKSFNNATAEKIVNELKVQREVDFHDNIIRFFGITIDDQNCSLKKYMLVMEYADSGTLREYLEKNIDNLTWNDKFKLAQQLASAVSCLHDENIIHCDLHPKNVLVHQDTIKLADFGLSKKLDEFDKLKSPTGLVRYVDPKRLWSDSNDEYSLNKKSDVYSIGVLLWEISSGRQPFKSNINYYLVVNIPKGLREDPIPNTPKDYEKIYTDCWKQEPDDRPDIHEVVTRLETIIAVNNSTKEISLSLFQIFQKIFTYLVLMLISNN